MHRRDEPDGFEQLRSTLAELGAVERRLQALEDVLTSGDPLRLPPAPITASARDPELRFMAAALAVGALARRMNVRLGSIERALEGRASTPTRETPARSRRRLKIRPAPRSKEAVQIRLVQSDPPSRPN